MSGPESAERTLRFLRAAPRRTSGRIPDEVHLHRALERARTDGPVLLVLGGHRMVVCLERDLPGAPGNPAADTGAAVDRASGTVAGHGRTAGARAEDLDVSTTVLTPRELQIARLAASGQRPGRIAVTLGIAPQTVRVHLHSVRSRCRAASVQDALAALARHHSWPTCPPGPDTVADPDEHSSALPDRRAGRRSQRSSNPALEGPPAGSP